MSDCVYHPGLVLHSGYGFVRVDGRSRGAHIVAWEQASGRPVPEGLVIDHTCHNIDPTCSGGETCPHRACVNPDHLEPVTRRENVLRGKGPAAVNARKTHCPEGHEFTEENTYRWRQSGGRIARACKTCHRRRAADRRAAKNAAEVAAARTYLGRAS